MNTKSYLKELWQDSKSYAKAAGIGVATFLILGADPSKDYLQAKEAGNNYIVSIEQSRNSEKKPKKAKDPLKGSGAALREKNRKADEDKLSRIKDERMLHDYLKKRYLVELTSNKRYYLDKVHYPYCRPWTKTFIERLSSQYYLRFHEPLKITSLVRTEEQQKKLDKTNVNAAPAKGPKASSHLRGATVDFSKNGMSAECIKWVRNVLKTLDARGIIEATEEFHQPVFDVMVYRDEYMNYLNGLKQTTTKKKKH